MYHYVGFPDPKYPYFRYLNFSNFKKQLDWFASNGGFVSKEDFFRVVSGEISANDTSGFLLTFDDGLYEHYNTVLPELKKRGLWGFFYIPALPYTEKKILDVHKTHLLLGMHGGKKMSDALEKLIIPDMLIPQDEKYFTDNTYTLQSNFSDEVNFKRILNYHLLYKYRENVLDDLFEQYVDAKINIDNIYMSEKMVKGLHDSGMIVGSHSITHRLMSRLSDEEQESEILASFDVIDKIVDGLKIKTFCYPYGGSYSYNKKTLSILNKNDILFSFSVNSKDIDKLCIHNQIQELPRYDTIEFPYGSSNKAII